jgi:hypothetical protein
VGRVRRVEGAAEQANTHAGRMQRQQNAAAMAAGFCHPVYRGSDGTGVGCARGKELTIHGL